MDGTVRPWLRHRAGCSGTARPFAIISVSRDTQSSRKSFTAFDILGPPGALEPQEVLLILAAVYASSMVVILSASGLALVTFVPALLRIAVKLAPGYPESLPSSSRPSASSRLADSTVSESGGFSASGFLVKSVTVNVEEL
jgi:hypothetical protein